MHWRRQWQPTPVLLPGESQGQRSLVGCHLWGRTESDMTEDLAVVLPPPARGAGTLIPSAQRQADALPSEPPMRPYEALSPHGGESSPSGSVGLSSLQSSVWGAGFPLFRRPAPEVLREAMKRLEQAKAS